MEIQYRNYDKEIFAPLKDKWLVSTPEERVRQQFICKLVNDYGYILSQMEQEYKTNETQRGSGRGAMKCDIAIWKSEQEKKEQKNCFIIVECKAETVTIREDDYFQGRNYARQLKSQFLVLHNEKETRFFKMVPESIRPKDFDEIITIPKANEVNNEKKIAEILSQTKKFERDEFQKLLFSCHDIIRNNDKLSPEMAFDEISKVLFMKIRHERKQNTIFSKEKFLELKRLKEEYETQILQGTSKKDDTPFYQYLFEQTKKEFQKDEIFAENEILRVRETSFLQIVEKLQKYNLSDTSDDVKGIAFEEFLGKTFRGDLGQFFTPRTLVDFMVSILDPQEKEIICDPCCGTGGFLIKTFEYVREKIETDIQNQKEIFRNQLIPEDFDTLPEKKQQKIITQLNKYFAELNEDLEVSEQYPESRLHKLSWNCIFGTDAEPRSARTAKMNMIMHGDGHGGVHHHDGLLNVNGIFENRFDVIVTNPPFGARISKDLEIHENDRFTNQEKIKYYTERYGEAYTEALKQVNDNINKKLLSLYDTGNFSTLTEVVFVERCLKLLRKGGRMGIVLPEGFLNGADLQKVRDYVEGKAKIILIVSVPQEVFMSAGATVKSSLVFLKKFTEEEETQYEKISATAQNEITEKYAPIIQAELQKVETLAQQVQEKKTEVKSLKKDKTKTTELAQINEELESLQAEYKARKQTFDTWKKETELQIQQEIKTKIKQDFDYEFPIVQAEKAGISSTGQATQNDLPAIKDEFTDYRKEKQLWGYETVEYEYALNEEGQLYKTAKPINF